MVMVWTVHGCGFLSHPPTSSETGLGRLDKVYSLIHSHPRASMSREPEHHRNHSQTLLNCPATSRIRARFLFTRAGCCCNDISRSSILIINTFVRAPPFP